MDNNDQISTKYIKLLNLYNSTKYIILNLINLVEI